MMESGNISEMMLSKVVELATGSGQKTAEMDRLKADYDKLKTDYDSLKTDYDTVKAELDSKAQENERQKVRIAELEEALAKFQQASAIQMQQNVQVQQNVILVTTFIPLDQQKTTVYCSSLGNDDRKFVGHMLMQTMVDNVPPSLLTRVREMTQLERPKPNPLIGTVEQLNGVLESGAQVTHTSINNKEDKE